MQATAIRLNGSRIGESGRRPAPDPKRHRLIQIGRPSQAIHQSAPSFANSRHPIPPLSPHSENGGGSRISAYPAVPEAESEHANMLLTPLMYASIKLQITARGPRAG